MEIQMEKITPRGSRFPTFLEISQFRMMNLLKAARNIHEHTLLPCTVIVLFYILVTVAISVYTKKRNDPKKEIV